MRCRHIVFTAAWFALLLPAGPKDVWSAAGQRDVVRRPAAQRAPGRQAAAQEAPKRDTEDAKRMRPGKDPGIMLERANRFAMQGRCDEAIPMLERLLSEYPQISAASEMLAECYLKEGRLSDAVVLLEKCLAEEPENFACLRGLGLAYIESGDKEKGVAAWRRILKDDEKHAALFGTVAKMEQEAGLYDEAIATLRAGKKFKEYGEYYSREIIRLERILGRDEDAFTEAILLIGRRPGSLEGELKAVADIFRESRRQDRLAGIADSLAAAGEDSSGVFRTLRAILLAETGRYSEVRAQIPGGDRSDSIERERSRPRDKDRPQPRAKDRPDLREEELHSLINYMAMSPKKRDDEHFRALHEEAMRAFLDRFGSSPRAPGIMLMMAMEKRETARSAGPDRARLLDEALALADEAKRHRLGGSYLERSALFKARVRFEDLGAPEEALAELDGARMRSPTAAAEAADHSAMRCATAGSASPRRARLRRSAA